MKIPGRRRVLDHTNASETLVQARHGLMLNPPDVPKTCRFSRQQGADSAWFAGKSRTFRKQMVLRHFVESGVCLASFHLGSAMPFLAD